VGQRIGGVVARTDTGRRRSEERGGIIADNHRNKKGRRNRFMQSFSYEQLPYSRPANKLLLAIAAFLLARGLILSCQKENLTRNDRNTPTGLRSACLDEDYCEDILCYLEDEEDLENEKVNMILYHYAKAVRDVAADSEYLCLMVNAMLEDTFTIGVSLPALAEDNVTFGDAINSALKESISEEDIFPKGEPGIDSLLQCEDWDANIYLKSQFKYGEDNYEPTIYFIMPPESCNLDGDSLVVLIAEDVNCCEEVPGWNGEEEVLVGEDEVMNSTGVIIFVGPGDPQMVSEGFSKPLVDNELNPVGFRSLDRTISVDEYQVKKGYRYESSCKSEVKGWLVAFTLSGPNPNINTSWDKKVKIHKNDIAISEIFTEDDYDAFSLSLKDWGKLVFIGTYEYDWWANKWLIPNDCSPYPQHVPSVRMKYFHEWYFHECGYISSWFPNVGSSKTFENEKCMFKLKRTK